MELEAFTLGSPVHVVALVGCVVVALLVALAGRNRRGSPAALRQWRWFIAIGSVLSWVATVLYGVHPERFSWESSLPLQFCNLANLIAAVAVLGRSRRAQTLLYFWGFALCPWAFLTPALLVGPAHSWFWIFWLYHLFIPVTLAWILAVEGYRPERSDLRFALSATWGFTLVLAGLNALTRWNYGFVGPGRPDQPSPIDLLGPYPLRILWMLLIGSAIFLLLYFPWQILLRRKPICQKPQDPRDDES